MMLFWRQQAAIDEVDQCCDVRAWPGAEWEAASTGINGVVASISGSSCPNDLFPPPQRRHYPGDPRPPVQRCRQIILSPYVPGVGPTTTSRAVICNQCSFAYTQGGMPRRLPLFALTAGCGTTRCTSIYWDRRHTQCSDTISDACRGRRRIRRRRRRSWVGWVDDHGLPAVPVMRKLSSTSPSPSPSTPPTHLPPPLPSSSTSLCHPPLPPPHLQSQLTVPIETGP